MESTKTGPPSPEVQRNIESIKKNLTTLEKRKKELSDQVPSSEASSPTVSHDAANGASTSVGSNVIQPEDAIR